MYPREPGIDGVLRSGADSEGAATRGVSALRVGGRLRDPTDAMGEEDEDGDGVVDADVGIRLGGGMAAASLLVVEALAGKVGGHGHGQLTGQIKAKGKGKDKTKASKAGNARRKEGSQSKSD